MTFSTQSRHSLAGVVETDFGTPPASPALTRIRHTGCDLSLSKSTIESDEIRDDRQLGTFLPGQHSVTGDIDFELAYGGFDTLLAAVCYSAWAGDTLKTGTLQTSFSLERAFNDIGQYQLFNGCVLDALSLTIQPESIISGRYTVVGKTMTMGTAPLDASVDPGAAFAPMDSFHGTIKEDGVVSALVAGIDLKIENDAEQSYVLGEEAASTITAGRSRISGEITVYFQDATLINKFLNKNASSLEINMSGEGGSYTILLPNILYTGSEAPVKGDRVVTLTLPFVALYDATTQSNIKITRIAD